MSSITPMMLFTHTEKELADMVRALKLAARCKYEPGDDSSVYDNTPNDDDQDNHSQCDTSNTDYTDHSWKDDEDNLAQIIANKEFIHMLQQCVEEDDNEEDDEEQIVEESAKPIAEIYPFFYEEYMNHDTVPIDFIITSPEEPLLFQAHNDSEDEK